MDPKLFKQWLDELTEIQPVKPSYNPGIRQDPDFVDQVRAGDQWIEIGYDHNPTLGHKIKRIKPRIRACRLDCGQMVQDQVIETRVHYHPEAHWVTRCKNCGQYRGPDGQLVENSPKKLQHLWIQHFRTLKQEK